MKASFVSHMIFGRLTCQTSASLWDTVTSASALQLPSLPEGLWLAGLSWHHGYVSKGSVALKGVRNGSKMRTLRTDEVSSWQLSRQPKNYQGEVGRVVSRQRQSSRSFFFFNFSFVVGPIYEKSVIWHRALNIQWSTWKRSLIYILHISIPSFTQ